MVACKVIPCLFRCSMALLMLSEAHEWIIACQRAPELFDRPDYFHFHVEKKQSGKEMVLKKGMARKVHLITLV